MTPRSSATITKSYPSIYRSFLMAIKLIKLKFPHMHQLRTDLEICAHRDSQVTKKTRIKVISRDIPVQHVQ